MDRLAGTLLLLVILTGRAPGSDELPRQTAGKYRVTLRLPAYGLYAQEEMEIEMRVEDTSRPDDLLGFSPVIRAGIEAGIEMPAMPGMPRYREVAHPEGIPGDYGFHPTFAHGGDYLLRLTVTPPADQPFQLEFPLRVLDAETRRKARPPRFRLEAITSPKAPKAGERVDLRLIVRAREQPKEVFSSFEFAHQKLMHLVIVRTDLTQFAHEHPSMSEDGVFHLQHTFPEAGEYHLFADIAPKDAGSQVLMAKIQISGKRTAAVLAGARALTKTVGNLEVELRPQAYPLPVKTTSRLGVSLRDLATGRPADNLQDYLGARGHLILIHQDAVTFVHSHPSETAAGANSTLNFLVRLPQPGLYRGWLQFQRSNQVVTADFLVEAAGNP